MPKLRYENIDGVRALNSALDLLKWRRERLRKKKDLSFQVPQAPNKEIAFLQKNRTENTVTWIGHSTFLIQYNGKNILTDPVWARRLGTDRRLTEPGLKVSDLPPIDLLLISHSHYDHLHLSSIKRLPGSPALYVPAGLEAYFRKKGFASVREFCWWEQQEFSGFKISFVPAQHWTKRTLTDTNQSHWGGWVIEADHSPSIYFAGDSGYFSGFGRIGEQFAIDYALMPIGAYEPEWFMSLQHVNPEQAVQAYLDTRARTFIPMHYGAYRLADDTPREALDRLQAEWSSRQLEEKRLVIPALGETLRIN